MCRIFGLKAGVRQEIAEYRDSRRIWWTNHLISGLTMFYACIHIQEVKTCMCEKAGGASFQADRLKRRSKSAISSVNIGLTWRTLNPGESLNILDSFAALNLIDFHCIKTETRVRSSCTCPLGSGLFLCMLTCLYYILVNEGMALFRFEGRVNCTLYFSIFVFLCN